jgi:replication factor A1
MASPAVGSSPPAERRLRDLRPGNPPAIVVARIVSAERRQVTRRSDGSARPVVSGFLSDGTASVRFTWWDPPHEAVERGTVVRAGPVAVSEFRGRTEVSFGWKTRVEPASEAELPELTAEERSPRGLATLAAGDDGFVVEVRIAEVAPRLVTVGMERRTVFSGILLDATGTIGFSSWADFRLAPGETVRIERAHVRGFQGRPQVVLDDWSRVERIDAPQLPPAESLGAATIPLGRLAEGAGAERVRVEGLAVALQPPSGLLTRCPSCRRGTEGGVCRVHGPVEGIPDLRLRLVLDDGTGTATVQLDRELAERVTGLTLDALRTRLAANPDPARLEGEIHGTVFGRRFRVVGSVRVDAFGAGILPSEIAELSRPFEAR